MPTYAQIVGDVRRQLSALKITDDTRLSFDHILFVVRYCLAKAQYDKVQDSMTRGIVLRQNPDPALYREYKLSVDPDTQEAELPVAPINLPLDQGLGGVYYYDEKDRCYRMVLVSNQYRAANSQNLWWANRTVTRIGNKLRFVNTWGLTEIRVLLLSTEPEEPFDVDAEFPIPSDLIATVISMTVQILSGPVSRPEDVSNDLKDQPGRP